MGHHGSDFEETGSDPAGAWSTAGARSHAVFQALALVEQAAPTLDGVATWSLSDGDLREAVAALFQHLQGVEAGWLGLARDLDTRPDAVPGARAGEVANGHELAVPVEIGVPGAATADGVAGRVDRDPAGTTFWWS